MKRVKFSFCNHFSFFSTSSKEKLYVSLFCTSVDEACKRNDTFHTGGPLSLKLFKVYSSRNNAYGNFFECFFDHSICMFCFSFHCRSCTVYLGL